MMIKVSNEYLDFDEVIEVEKQIKLFEDISTTDGDFSYSFDIPKTLNNTRLLQNPFPDNINKPVYQQIPAKLLSDGGAETYDGYLRVERVTDVYSCSFFAGNNNWFAMITGLLSELDLTAYDIQQTAAEIEYSWTRTEGIVFPILDNGGLLTRSYPQTKIEDYVGGFYIKTIFNQIFVEAGIKIQGELINDWMYNNAICLKNSKNQEEIDARSSFVQTTNSPNPKDATYHQMQWTDDSTFPYFDGAQDNFDLAAGKYVADVKMNVKVDIAIYNAHIPGLVGAFKLAVYVNGVLVREKVGGGDPMLMSVIIPLEAGDELTIWTYNDATIFSNPITDATVKITPNFIYKIFGNTAIPNWSKQQFVSNVLRLFNVLASYNEGDAILTLNLFEKIKSKPTIDLSEYISETEVDYSDFISDYGKRSKLSYQQVDFKELKDYNISQYFKYGQGVINVDNDFIDTDADVLESDFANAIAYINGVFDMSMEKTNLIEMDEGEGLDVTGVTDSSGVARFAVPEDIYLVGDLIRIKDASNPTYNGDWVVNLVGAGYFELQGVAYDTNATAGAIKLDYTYNNSDDVFIFINIPSYEIEKFSGNTAIMLEDTAKTSFGVAYFDLINTGRQINLDFIFSLSFGGIDDPLHYQVTMIDQYFRLFTRVLNDPVKLYCTANIPYYVFHQIDFLSPITIKTLETVNSYYLNRITGYKEPHYECTIELIKLG